MPKITVEVSGPHILHCRKVVDKNEPRIGKDDTELGLSPGQKQRGGRGGRFHHEICAFMLPIPFGEANAACLYSATGAEHGENALLSSAMTSAI